MHIFVPLVVMRAPITNWCNKSSVNLDAVISICFLPSQPGELSRQIICYTFC
jgi:hypothetical protein